MKSKLLTLITVSSILAFTGIVAAQPNLGTCSQFELFTSSGAISNTGISQVTGNVGSNAGSSTGFGNVNGVMHDNDGASAAATADLTIAYNQLNATVPTFFPAPLLGNGQVLNAGVYYIATPATLNLGLTLDGQGNPSAVFIFQIDGAFATNALSHVNLVNGALACNVFWMVEGLVSMGPGCAMRGTIVANNAAINMSTGDTLEGRALSTAGAITIDGVLAYTPIGCGSPVLMGPIAPNLASAECYAIFSSDGPVTNVGVTNVLGDVGTNNGSVTGFNPLLVVGAIHAVPDGSTAACSADLLNAYNYVNLLPNDIELLYPAQFGNNLVLTPHTYVMLSACTFTDTLYLNAENSPNAVFIIKIYGALNTSTYSKVKLINGAQAKNVYWMVDGAVTINDYSVFQGTIICNNGAMNLNTNMTIYGRALTTTGALGTAAITAIVPPGCGNLPQQITTPPVNQVVCLGDSVSFTVSASGAGITYQWRRGNINLVNFGNISGVTTATLTINPVTLLDAANDYNVIIGGPFGPTDTSSNVSLTVNTPPAITSQPINQISCSGDAVSFTVSATGSGLMYQWRKGLVNLVNSGTISGVNTATLTINPVNVTDAALNYNVIVSGSCAPPDTSLDASLVVNAPVVITSQPSNQIACPGDSISFSVTATGTGLMYQWRKGNTNLINAGNISGVTTPLLTIDPVTLLDAAPDYNVIVSGTGCIGDTSTDASLNVNALAIIILQPSDQTVCEGTSVSFTVGATGAGITYQWRNGTVNLVNSGNISGALTATLTINPVNLSDAGTNYNVVINGTCAPSVTSNNVTLAVDSAPNAVASSNSPVCTDSAIFLSAQTVSGATYSWAGPNSFTSSDQNPTIGSATSAFAGTYTLSVTANGCNAQANTTVTVATCPDTDFHIPNGFSPNGDGTNDLFVIRGILNFPENTFSVYNRWGNLVFQANPYQNTWDGSSAEGISVGGDQLPVGIYFYVLDLGNDTPVYKGTIYLNR
jgi:gliding motility-associated-like protein